MATAPATEPAPRPNPGAGSRRDLLVVSGVSKRFGITQALDTVSVTMHAGEVHALMGENGAGKSTLGKAIAGLHKPDTGSITVDGRSLALGSIKDATAAGIRIVHQELAQCPNLSVAENLCLHDLPTSMGMIDRDRMNRRAARLLAKLAPEIDVQAPLGTLAPGRRQIVQIASSLDDESGTPRIIIFDEPTSSLSIAEAERLMQIVRSLAAEGLLCIYVSHRMNEIFSCCDRITVLRDGKFVATSVIKEISEAAVVGQMIGRTLDASASKRAEHARSAAAAAPVALEVKSVSSPGKLSDISLNVRSGEILGIGGLVGAGRSELLDALFGLDPVATGTVRVGGTPLPAGNPRASIAAGLGYVPEDRRLQGLFFDMGIDENIALPFMSLLAKFGIRAAVAEKTDVLSRIKRLQVKTATLQSRPGELSGGNQQKLLLARWMDERTKVLLLDEPTRGIDVGTKAEIYKLVWQAADAGMAVLLVSSEMPELLLLSDRIVVMCEGEITGELSGPSMTQENILNLATAKHRSAG
jgi:rhamnose transport system ATP-binding protein